MTIWREGRRPWFRAMILSRCAAGGPRCSGQWRTGHAATDTITPRSRRAILAGALGAVAASVAHALGRPAAVRAGVDGDVVLGASNSTMSLPARTNTAAAETDWPDTPSARATGLRDPATQAAAVVTSPSTGSMARASSAAGAGHRREPGRHGHQHQRHRRQRPRAAWGSGSTRPATRRTRRRAGAGRPATAPPVGLQRRKRASRSGQDGSGRHRHPGRQQPRRPRQVDHGTRGIWRGDQRPRRAWLCDQWCRSVRRRYQRLRPGTDGRGGSTRARALRLSRPAPRASSSPRHRADGHHCGPHHLQGSAGARPTSIASPSTRRPTPSASISPPTRRSTSRLPYRYG